MSLTGLHIEQTQTWDVVATYSRGDASEEVRLPFKYKDRAERVLEALQGDVWNKEVSGYPAT